MKRVFNMIIVDESGSMSIIKKQALAGLNETIDTVKKMQKMHPEMQQRISLLTFDSSHRTFKYDNVKADTAHLLTAKDYNPGGCTPLYDAIGIAISKLNAHDLPTWRAPCITNGFLRLLSFQAFRSLNISLVISIPMNLWQNYTFFL